MPRLTDQERERFRRIREMVGGDGGGETGPEIPGGFGPVDPMLAHVLEKPLDRVDPEEWVAEVKYDGTRLILQKFDGEVRAYTRSGVERSGDVPRVVEEAEALPDETILDGEFVFLDRRGASDFLPIQTAPEKVRKRGLTPRYVAFDALYRGESLARTSLAERREVLDTVVDEGNYLVTAERWERDFPSALRRVMDRGEEGLMLKRRGSWYYPGVRSRQWLKVKEFRETDVIVVGYTAGTGSRRDSFGALVLTDGEKFIGLVGSGFTEQEIDELRDQMKEANKSLVTEAKVGERFVPVEPFVVTVKYQEVTSEDRLRAPVYVRRRPDKPLKDVEAI